MPRWGIWNHESCTLGIPNRDDGSAEKSQTEPSETDDPETAAEWLPDRTQPSQSQGRKKVEIDPKRNKSSVWETDRMRQQKEASHMRSQSSLTIPQDV